MNAVHTQEPSTFDRAKPIALGLFLAALGIAGLRVLQELTAAQLLFNLTIIYVLSTMLVVRRERMLDNMLVLVAPAKRDRTRLVMEKIWFRLGAYLRAKVVVMVAVGVLMYVALRILGVPFA